MVFRKDAKTDTFQRQISALRQQLGDGEEISPAPVRAASFGSDYAAEVPAASARFGTPSPSGYDLESPSAPEWPQPAGDGAASVVAHETIWNGELQATGPLHIRGRVEGSIVSRSDVFVAEEAEVEATVTAENLSIAGSVSGSVRVSGRLEILPSGRVTGDVFAPVLVVHEGASLNGQFSMTTAPADGAISPLRRRSGAAGA
ncbi:MAG: polymer-forming cytoskeletal protein [Chloroflexota bacterium]